jgi:hypothetical protein
MSRQPARTWETHHHVLSVEAVGLQELAPVGQGPDHLPHVVARPGVVRDDGVQLGAEALGAVAG